MDLINWSASYPGCLLQTDPSLRRWCLSFNPPATEAFTDEPLRAAVKDHEKRATMVLDLEEKVAATVKAAE
jgi:hypothetical protein